MRNVFTKLTRLLIRLTMIGYRIYSGTKIHNCMNYQYKSTDTMLIQKINQDRNSPIQTFKNKHSSNIKIKRKDKKIVHQDLYWFGYLFDSLHPVLKSKPDFSLSNRIDLSTFYRLSSSHMAYLSNSLASITMPPYP